MGLDVLACSKLQKWDGLSESTEDDDDSVLHIIGGDFPERCSDLPDGYYRKAGAVYGFRAGSYSGYNIWRDQLAIVVGFHGAQDVWNTVLKPGETLPFYELIHFTDCGGTIGTIVCKKLAKDFADYENRARERAQVEGGEYFLEKYLNFKKAFELASDAGAVQFA